jgi:integrase
MVPIPAAEIEPVIESMADEVFETIGRNLPEGAAHSLQGRNVAKGRRRRLPTSQPRRTWLDRAEHIAALLDAAGELDLAARYSRGQRRALLATLVYAGPRIGEALALRWRDVDLARGAIRIRGGKTAAAARTIYVLPALRDELAAYRARLRDVEQDALVFGTTTGEMHSTTNIRRRVLAKAVQIANDRIEAGDDGEPLPERLTPHSLRRTFASLLFAVGETPPYVMSQMGHTTASLTLAIYAREMDRRDGEPQRLRALVNGEEWAPAGTSTAGEALSTPDRVAA